ncbi:MAG: hypothetical protein V4617_18925 [Gemmatimonadota bacterium]
MPPTASLAASIDATGVFESLRIQNDGDRTARHVVLSLFDASSGLDWTGLLEQVIVRRVRPGEAVTIPFTKRVGPSTLAVRLLWHNFADTTSEWTGLVSRAGVVWVLRPESMVQLTPTVNAVLALDRTVQREPLPMMESSERQLEA